MLFGTSLLDSMNDNNTSEYIIRKNRRQKFISDVVIKGLTQLLVGIRGLIFLSVIAKNLGASSYGIWSQIIITSTLISPLLILKLNEASVRYFGSESNKEKPKIFFSMLSLIWTILIFVYILTKPFSNQISLLIFGKAETIIYFNVLILFIITRATFMIVHVYYRSINKIKKHSAIEILRNILEVSIISVLIIYFNFQLSKAVIVLICIEAFIAFGMLFNVINEIGFSLRFNLKEIIRYLKYCIPLLPSRILSWLINFSDRYIIVYFMGLGAVGIYSAAYRLGQIVKLLLEPISFTLLPLISILWEQKNFSEVRKYTEHSLKYYLFFATPAVFIISQLGPVILTKLATEEFLTNRWLIFFITAGIFFFGAHRIYVFIIFLGEKTWLFPIVSFFGAGLNIGLNFILIPKIGLMGAAIATFVSYLFKFIAIVVLAKKLFPIGIDLKSLTKCLFSSASMFLIIRALDPQNLLEIIGVVFLGIFVYISLMILIKGFEKKEWNLIKSLIR